MRVIGGFGSAGAGNRTGRRTASAVGVGQTAKDRDYRVSRLAAPADPRDPAAGELWPYIKNNECWWCKAPKQWKALSQHLTRAHNIDLQKVRDILQVPKNYSFINDSLKDRFAARGRKYYRPDKLHHKSRPRKLSAFGIRRNREKLAAIPEDERKAIQARATAAIAQKTHTEAEARYLTKQKSCCVCGTRLTYAQRRHVTCSVVCDRKRRSIRQLEHPSGHLFGRGTQ